MKQSTTLLAIRRLYVFSTILVTLERMKVRMITICNLRMMQFIDLIANPRKWSSKKSGNYFLTWQEKLGISVPDSHSKHLMRKCQNNMFQELQFVSYQHKKVLVYTISLEMQNVIIENFELNFLLKLTSSKSDNEDSVFQVAKLLKGTIKNQQPQMSWPPTKDLKADKISSYIPHLLDILFTVLISGHSS